MITKEEMVPNVAYPTEPTEIVYENPYRNFTLYAEHRWKWKYKCADCGNVEYRTRQLKDKRFFPVLCAKCAKERDSKRILAAKEKEKADLCKGFGAWILSSCADKSVDPTTASIDELFDIYRRSIKESNSHK